jgi:hypothetical protein
LVCGF